MSLRRTAASGDADDGAPMSRVEAQTSGILAVSTFHAETLEDLLDDRTGLLSPQGDAEGLAHNLERLVVQPQLGEPMGTATRRHVAESHNVRTQAARLEAIYTSPLTSKPGGGA